MAFKRKIWVSAVIGLAAMMAAGVGILAKGGEKKDTEEQQIMAVQRNSRKLAKDITTKLEASWGNFTAQEQANLIFIMEQLVRLENEAKELNTKLGGYVFGASPQTVISDAHLAHTRAGLMISHATQAQAMLAQNSHVDKGVRTELDGLLRLVISYADHVDKNAQNAITRIGSGYRMLALR